MAILLLSQGVPMFLAGDEFLNTQAGNNNAWCQDNAVSWLDWSFTEIHQGMLRFVRELADFRHRHPCLSRTRFLTGQPESGRGVPDIAWHGLRLNEPLWHDHQAQVLAFTLAGRTQAEEDVHVVLNMSDTGIDAQLPEIPARHWHLALDTAARSPLDIIPRPQQLRVDTPPYAVHPRSIVVFEARALTT